jgi:hypothetical protein
MKNGSRFVHALICGGCLVGFASGFPTHEVRGPGSTRWNAPPLHHAPPFCPRREQAERAISVRPSISVLLLHSSKDPIDKGDVPLSAPSRRKWLASSFTSASAAAAAMLALTSTPTPAVAAAKKSEAVAGNPFDAIRYEVSDPKGGVAYLRDRIEARDFASVLDFTKEYDLVFRKIAMGTAKKRLPKGPVKDRGTELCNAVTFDLIGINRNSRKGQENVGEARKYLAELVQDATQMIELEKYAEQDAAPSS